MPQELPTMTGAELQATREFLGLSRTWLADKLQIGERRIMRMEAEQQPIPDAIVTLMDEVASYTKDAVSGLVNQYRRRLKASPNDPVLFLTYRNDETYAEQVSDARFPSRWHRMVASRVCEAVPGLVLSYWELGGQPDLTPPWERTGAASE